MKANGDDGRRPISVEQFYQWYEYLEACIAQIEIDQLEAGMRGFTPLLVIRGEHHNGHGVVMAKNKHSRDYLADNVDKIGKLVDGAVSVPGVDGIRVSGWPVTNDEGTKTRVEPTIILTVKIPKGVLSLGYSPQKMLEYAFKRSGISPEDQQTMAAFNGGRAHYMHPEDPTIMYFTATADLVDELVAKPEPRDCPAGHLYTGLSFQPVLLGGRKINQKTRMVYGWNTLPPKHITAIELEKFQEAEKRRKEAKEKAKEKEKDNGNRGSQGKGGPASGDKVAN